MHVEARLRAFAAFARRRSFSGAAAELRISQPAVSRHVADLERILGLGLVRRAPRGASLTPAGDYLAGLVLRAEAILEQAERGLREFREPGSGTLTIVASGIPGTYLVPEAVAAFQRLHPGVRVHLELATSGAAVERVRAHGAELGVVGGFAAAPEIEAEPLARDEIVVVGPPRLAGRRLSARELESLTWISREEGSASRAAVEAAWQDLGIAPARRLELPAWEAVKLAVARGHGIAACSRFAVESEVRAGSLACLRVRGWNVRRTISLVRLRDAPLTPSAEAFAAMLRARRGLTPAGRPGARSR